jgi:hypothetical protein
MVRYYAQYHGKSTNFWMSPMVNSKVGIDFATFFTLRESRRTSCQGIAVANYSFTLDAPAWRDHTSDFISFGVRLDSEALRLLQRWGKVIGIFFN